MIAQGFGDGVQITEHNGLGEHAMLGSRGGDHAEKYLGAEAQINLHLIEVFY